MGICHAYAPDGRCISLLKILLTNSCIFDCHYCINRKSSNVRRARFTAQEVVELTLAFYSRNYIEGLFLSSGIIRIVQLHDGADGRGRAVACARTMISAATSTSRPFPTPIPELVHQAGRYADRVSINVELPTAAGLATPRARKDAARGSRARWASMKARDRGRRRTRRSATSPRPASRPAGQSTQMIVGADAATDGDIVDTRQRRSTIASLCGASIIRPSARSPMRARCCRCSARR